MNLKTWPSIAPGLSEKLEAVFSDTSAPSHVLHSERWGLKRQHFLVHSLLHYFSLVSVAIVTSDLFRDALMITKLPTIDKISGFEGCGQYRASCMHNTQSPVRVRFLPLGKER